MNLLARCDERIKTAQSLQSDAFWVQELPRLIAERDAVANLIECAGNMLEFAESALNNGGPHHDNWENYDYKLSDALIGAQS